MTGRMTPGDLYALRDYITFAEAMNRDGARKANGQPWTLAATDAGRLIDHLDAVQADLDALLAERNAWAIALHRQGVTP